MHTAIASARRATRTRPSQRLPPVDFTSGYFQRAMDKLPRQGSRKPWRIYQNYLRDL